MAIPWGTIKSLVIFFGPLLLPRLIRFYKTLRAESQQPRRPIRPLPAPTFRALVILAAVALVFALGTLPILSPENVFQVTQSRLQIPTDVLFTRLSALRPDNALTPQDEALRARLASLEARLLYLKFGPAVSADCPFCRSDEPATFFQYALPDLLAPHLFNLVVLALATSGLFAPPPPGGGGGSSSSMSPRWRTLATVGAVGLAAADVFLVNSHNHQANARALRLSELDLFFWTMRAYRHLSLAALDLLVGAALYLSATNRMFVGPPPPAERIEAAARALGAAKSKMNAMGIVKNTAIRDEELRTRGQAYWAHEVRLMREVMEEREVVDGVSDALQNRVDIANISREAEAYAQSVLRFAPPRGGDGTAAAPAVALVG